MTPPTGMVQGGWEYVYASYALTAVVLLGYAVSLIARHRRARRTG